MLLYIVVVEKGTILTVQLIYSYAFVVIDSEN